MRDPLARKGCLIEVHFWIFVIFINSPALIACPVVSPIVFHPAIVFSATARLQATHPCGISRLIPAGLVDGATLHAGAGSLLRFDPETSRSALVIRPGECVRSH